jgi:hypothetical protein
MHILFELANRFGGECVGDCFPFACMLSPITSVEKAALYRYEGIVVLAISGGRQPTGTLLGICNCGVTYAFRKPFP